MDLTDNGKFGRLFPSGDVQQLAALLQDTLQGTVDTAKQGKEAHEFIRQRFKLEHHC